MDAIDKLLLIGLPATGKTTFLAAFWYLVDGRKETILTIDQLHGDREYLNNIRDNWVSCDPLERTRSVNVQVVSMKLLNTKTQKIVDLHIPDLSGETYSNQWSKRGWTQEFQDMITDANGALFFIHPDKLVEPTRIDQADALNSEISDEVKQDKQEIANDHVEWNPDLAPTQVQLVELLQFIEHSQATNTPFKVAIIISAWDLLKDFDESPETWLEKRLPLLKQYLLGNADIFPHRIYGVSAQGGKYDSDGEKLTSIMQPADRIEIKGPNYTGNDLTVPIAWLMENGI